MPFYQQFHLEIMTQIRLSKNEFSTNCVWGKTTKIRNTETQPKLAPKFKIDKNKKLCLHFEVDVKPLRVFKHQELAINKIRRE